MWRVIVASELTGEVMATEEFDSRTAAELRRVQLSGYPIPHNDGWSVVIQMVG